MSDPQTWDKPHREEAEEERGREIVDLGAESLSAIAGAAAGSFLGPGGAIGGAAAGPALTRALRWAGRELRSRLFSPKEEQRVGGAFVVALTRMGERLDSGERARDDGLFDPDSDPEGMLEGTLLLAARSYQEKKVPFVGAFYASFAFSDVSAETAQYLLRLLDRLTYRQLCALAWIASDRYTETAVQMAAEAQAGDIRSSPTIVAELGDLANYGLVGYEQEGGWVANPLATLGGGMITASSFDRVALADLGRILVRMAELNRIPSDDQKRVIEALRGELP